MEDILLLIIYIAIFMAQIVFLIKTIKSDNNTHWLCIMAVGVIVIITSIVSGFYYDSLPGSGFMGMTYLGVILLCMGAAIFNTIILFVAICAKIILFENAQKKLGRPHKSPFRLILATIFIFIGIYFLGQEIVENQGKKEALGTVVGFEEEEINVIRDGVRYVDIVQYPIVRFFVDGNEFEDTAYTHNVNVGDMIKIHYVGYSSGNCRITYLVNYKYFYIPLFVMGLAIIYFRFRRKNI